MRTYVIIDRGTDPKRTLPQFSVAQYADDGSSVGEAEELLLSPHLMSYVPSRHLVEELARRVNCHVVVDDDPSPTDISETWTACSCAYPGESGTTRRGSHHHPRCPMFDAGPM
jgi:hypothetical protein